MDFTMTESTPPPGSKQGPQFFVSLFKQRNKRTDFYERREFWISNKGRRTGIDLSRLLKQTHTCRVLRPLSRVPFRWLWGLYSQNFVCFALEDGNYRQRRLFLRWRTQTRAVISPCRECDGKGLGWIYENTNVFSSHLQSTVKSMTTHDKQIEFRRLSTVFVKEFFV